MSAEVFSGFVGIILPPFVDFINVRLGATQWRYKFIVALLSSIVVGTGMTAISQGGFSQLISNADALLISIGIIFTTSQTVYNTYWGPEGKSIEFKKKLGGDVEEPSQDTKKTTK